jgi:DNA repair exonuclease SbcCD ATPase subunit
MLSPYRLNLDGFGSYDKLENLPLNEPGTTFINGPIGSGKSTIPNVVYYLLYGKLLKGKSEFVSVKDYANKLLNSGYDISLEYDVGNDHYKIREIRDRKVDGESGLIFEKNGQRLMGKGDVETRELIRESLDVSVSAEDFENIAILTRRQSQKLVHGRSSDRARAIVEVFGLGKYDEFIVGCDEDVKDSKKNKEILIGNVKDYKESVESLKDSLVSSDEEMEEVTESGIEEVKKKIGEVKNKLKTIQEKESDVREFLGKVEALKEQKEKARELDEEIVKLREELKNIEGSNRSPESIDVELEKLRFEKANVDAEIRHIRSEIKKIDELGGKCPINNEECPSDIPTIYKEEVLDDYKHGLEKCTGTSSNFSSKIEGLKDLKEEIEKCGEIKSRIKQKTELRGSLLIEEIADAEEKEKLLEKCKDGKERGNARLEELQEEHRRITSINDQAKQREEFERNTKKLIEQKENQIIEFENELEKMDIELRYLSAASAVFKRAKMYKIDLVLDLLEDNSNRVLSRITGGEKKLELASQRKDSKGKKALDKLGVIVHDPYKSLPVELVSDGQETQVGLALLFGMWKTANTLSDKAVSLLFLDEVFGPLHQDIINDVLAAIVEVIQEIGAKSVYIISHRDLDTRLFNREFRTEINNGISNLEIIHLRENSHGRRSEEEERKAG